MDDVCFHKRDCDDLKCCDKRSSGVLIPELLLLHICWIFLVCVGWELVVDLTSKRAQQVAK